jgi:diadenylate cyclase
MGVHFSILDLIDVLLVAVILFQLYKLIRGTAALSIFIGIFLIYMFWLVVRALNMQLISALLGQVVGVGVIALIIVFQQEVRRFLLIIGNRQLNNRFSFRRFFRSGEDESGSPKEAEEIVRAAEIMSVKKTGALIVVGRKSSLDLFSEGGVRLDAIISASVIETIFFKNSPLHDGALLIEDGKIYAARCPLPITDRISLPGHLGMRHRAAIGVSEHTDSLVIVVSEETGRISIVEGGEIRENISPNDLRKALLKEKI